jgi:membrane protein DedA with SNARE-associated domain
VISELLKEITLWFGSLGYWGVFLACLGIFPAEIVIAMLAALKPNNLLMISAVAALGETVGAILTYVVGFHFRNRNLLGFLNGKGKFLQISEESYQKGHKSVRTGGSIYLFISRFVPWLRVVTVIVAGYLKFNILIVSVMAFVGTYIYAYVFAYIGAEIGFNWDRIKGIIDTFNNASLALIIIGIGIYVYINRKKIFGGKFRKQEP